MFMKFAIPSLFMALTCIAQADSSCCNPCPAPAPCCPAPDPCASCAQLWPSRGPDWIVTPNAGPCVRDGADVFVTADFIYWTAHEDHLGFASTSGSITNSTSLHVPKGTTFHPDWEFRPGFKVGLGMLFDHDGWDIYANYTWIRFNDIDRHVHAKNSSILLNDNIWFVNQTDSGATFSNQTASGKWKLHFNVIDLELGRNFFVSRYLHLRPHFGFKGTWQEQEMDVTFSGTGTPSGGGSVFNAFRKSENKMDNWGIGLRAGLDSAWHFTKSFSLVGQAAVSALWEQFEVNRKDFIHNLNANTFSSKVNYDDNFHTIKPVLELYLGLRWESWYCCDAYHFSAEAGWEEQFWGDQNQFIQEAVETRLGDLIFQGLTVKVRFDF